MPPSPPEDINFERLIILVKRDFAHEVNTPLTRFEGHEKQSKSKWRAEIFEQFPNPK